jgi:hypothetical protein
MSCALPSVNISSLLVTYQSAFGSSNNNNNNNNKEEEEERRRSIIS